MAEVDSGKGQDGSGENSVCNRKKKGGSGMGTRERIGFSNKKEACKKKVPRQSRSTFIMKYC